jgi:hypothetical protein
MNVLDIDELQCRVLDAVMDSPMFADAYESDDEAVQEVFEDIGGKGGDLLDQARLVVYWLKSEYKFDALPYIRGSDGGRAPWEK